MENITTSDNVLKICQDILNIHDEFNFEAMQILLTDRWHSDYVHGYNPLEEFYINQHMFRLLYRIQMIGSAMIDLYAKHSTAANNQYYSWFFLNQEINHIRRHDNVNLLPSDDDIKILFGFASCDVMTHDLSDMINKIYEIKKISEIESIEILNKIFRRSIYDYSPMNICYVIHVLKICLIENNKIIT